MSCSGITAGELFDWYVDGLRARHVSKAQIQHATSAAVLFARVCGYDMPAGEVTLDELFLTAGAKIEEGCSASTAAHYERVIVAAFGEGYRAGLLSSDPFFGYRPQSLLDRDGRADMIYVIRFGLRSDLYKIGHTHQPVASRMPNIQTGAPAPLFVLAELPGTKGDERRIHRQMSAHRVRSKWGRGLVASGSASRAMPLPTSARCSAWTGRRSCGTVRR